MLVAGVLLPYLDGDQPDLQTLEVTVADADNGVILSLS